MFQLVLLDHISFERIPIGEPLPETDRSRRLLRCVMRHEFRDGTLELQVRRVISSSRIGTPRFGVRLS
jgi:hypothetical protein